MSRKVPVRVSMIVALVAVTVAGANGAWGCFPLPVLTVQPRASGPGGTQVTVEGVDFGEGVESEIRWNAIDGPLLARGSRGAFSVSVTIPQVDDGDYAIVAFSRLVDDSVGVKAATTFRIDSRATVGRSPTSAVTTDRSSSTSDALSPAATAALALIGGAVFVAGGLGGAFLSRRRRDRWTATPASAEVARR